MSIKQSLGTVGTTLPAQSLFICDVGIQATKIRYVLSSSILTGQSVDITSGLQPARSPCSKDDVSGDFREWMGGL